MVAVNPVSAFLGHHTKLPMRSILLARCELRLRYSSPHKSWPEFEMQALVILG